MKKTLAALALAAFTVLGSPAAAQSVDVTGHWETDATNAGGRGGGHFPVDITQHGSALRWAAVGGGQYICSMRGTRCSGTWSGSTGSGWFDVTFSGNGSSFSGQWGYDDNRAVWGSWTGTR